MLTATACNNANPKDKPYKLSDEKGLFLLVHTNGSKYRRLNYRFADKQKTLSFGVYPEITLAEARSKRDKARKLIAHHTAPGAAKQEAKRVAMITSANSFETIAREWLEHMKGKWLDGHYAYHRSEYLVERRNMMQQWADYLEKLKATTNAIQMAEAA